MPTDISVVSILFAVQLDLSPIFTKASHKACFHPHPLNLT